MGSTEIKIDYDGLSSFAGIIQAKGSDLGTSVPTEMMDYVSTIPANAAAHAALTDESNIRGSMGKFSYKDSTNIRVIGKGFITTEKKLEAFYDATFDYDIVGKNAEGEA